MGKNKIKNMFYKALLNSQIFEFITGQGEYFIQDRDYDGHNTLQSFKQYAETYLEASEINVFDNIFWQLVNDELQNSGDYNLFLENLISFLLPYFSIRDEYVLNERVLNVPEYFSIILKITMNNHKDSLVKDTRGIGVEWNTSNNQQGIYGGVIYLLNLIEKRSGLKLFKDNN